MKFVKNIMRSLGYVPLAVCTDLNAEIAGLNRELTHAQNAYQKDIAGRRAKASADNIHAAELVSALREEIAKKNNIIVEHFKTLENYRRSAIVLSVFVTSTRNEDGKATAHNLMLATLKNKGGVAVKLRSLVASSKNRKTLEAEAARIADALGVTNTTDVQPGATPR